MLGSAVVILISLLATAVAREKALSQVDTDILNTLGGPDYVMVVIFTATVSMVVYIILNNYHDFCQNRIYQRSFDLVPIN